MSVITKFLISDDWSNSATRYYVAAHHVSRSGMVIKFNTWANSKVWDTTITWMACA